MALRKGHILLFVLIAKDCLLTGQEQACTRITRLFGWFIGCHHAENGRKHRKIAVDCALMIKSKGETLDGYISSLLK